MATAVVEEGSSLTNVVSNDTTSKSVSSTPRKRAGGLDLASIAPIINAGFRAVLDEASKLGVLDPPHGRTPMPDPKKITEEEASAWSDDGDPAEREETDTEVSDEQPPTAVGTPEPEEEEDDDEDDKLLEYKFDYGFNPLVFLGEYLRKNNPAALRARQEQRNADLEYLRGRAAKSLAREAALAELRELVVHRQSGITHGPIVGEVSDCGGIVWARAFRSGELLLYFFIRPHCVSWKRNTHRTFWCFSQRHVRSRKILGKTSMHMKIVMYYWTRRANDTPASTIYTLYKLRK